MSRALGLVLSLILVACGEQGSPGGAGGNAGVGGSGAGAGGFAGAGGSAGSGGEAGMGTAGTGGAAGAGGAGSAAGGGGAGGAAQIEVLARGLVNAMGIATEGGFVYWTEQGNSISTATGSVSRIATGGGPVVALATAQPLPMAIAVDAQAVYWTNTGIPLTTDTAGSIMSVPIAGGPPVELAHDQPRPFAIGVHAGSLFWVNNGSRTVTSAEPGVFTRSAGVTTRLAMHGATSRHLFFDGAHVFLLDAWQNTIWGVPLPGSGSANQDLTNLGRSLWDFAIQSGDVVLSDRGPGLFRAPLSGGTPALLDTESGVQPFLAVDSSNVYWSHCPLAGKCSIRKVPLAGGSSQVIADDQPASAITLDATALYWINPTAGTLSRMAK